MQVEIIDIADDEKLQRYVFQFRVSVDTGNQSMIQVDLCYYAFERRKTRRHGWKREIWWDTYNERDSKIDKPTLSEQVKINAIEKVKERIEFKESK
jgi:hypothetical protein